MEYSSIIIGVVITLVIGILVIILATNGARKSKKMVQKLLDELKSRQIYLTEYDKLGLYFIGVDVENKKLVYFRDSEEKDDYEIYDLKNVSFAANNVPIDKNNINENLYIILTSRENGSKIKLEFYNASFGLSANKEIALIVKWTNRVNEIIK